MATVTVEAPAAAQEIQSLGSYKEFSAAPASYQKATEEEEATVRESYLPS